MVHKIKQRLIMENVLDFDLVKGASVGGGDVVPFTAGLVTLTDEALRMVRHSRLTLTAAVISITNALAYGSVKLCDLPDSNLVLLGVEANFPNVVKDGTGILTGELPEIAIGTAVASNATLSGAMEDVFLGKALASGLDVPYVNHTNDHATPALHFLDDSGSAGLWLNSAVNPTGDGTLTITGTVDLFYLDTGNVGS